MVYSASDVFGSFLVIIGANLSGKAADEEHPYGHERMECVISIILAQIQCQHTLIGQNELPHGLLRFLITGMVHHAIQGFFEYIWSA